MFRKRLDECKVGDIVRLWCIGWDRWDNEVCKIVDIGFYITVEYSNGKRGKFIDSTECRVEFKAR